MPTNVSEEAAPAISALHICDEAPTQASDASTASATQAAQPIDASSLAAAATASATAAAAAAARDAPMVVLEGTETVVVLSAAPASAAPAADGESLLLALPAELGVKVLASLPLASLVRSRAACRCRTWTANVVEAMSSLEAPALIWLPALPNLPALPALRWLYQAAPNFLPTRVSLPRVGCNGCVALLRANADRAAALRELDLEGATAVTDSALQAIGFAAPPLRRLALRHNSNISDLGIFKLGETVLAGLEELSLGGCTKLTNVTLDTLVDDCEFTHHAAPRRLSQDRRRRHRNPGWSEMRRKVCGSPN